MAIVTDHSLYYNIFVKPNWKHFRPRRKVGDGGTGEKTVCTDFNRAAVSFEANMQGKRRTNLSLVPWTFTLSLGVREGKDHSNEVAR